MLLVFGVRYLHALIATGTFHCPVCGVDRPYRQRGPRAWFHAFWIPLVPLRRGAPFVECDVCRSRWIRTAAAYLATSAEASGPALDRAVEVLQRSLGPAYTRETLEADLAAHRQGSDLTVLGRLAGQLDVLGKERLLRGLADLELAIRDGREPDWSRLGDVAGALGITPAHLRGIVQEARARSR